MKIAVIGSVGVPASYGGFETLVEHLIEIQLYDFTVYCSGKHFNDRLKSYKGAKLVYLPLRANGPSSVLYDIFSILHGILMGHKQFLILGTSGAIIIPVLRFFFPNVKIATNIDGQEWNRSKWHGFAKWFLKRSESIAVRYSNAIIADNEAIADDIWNSYGRECRIIAYGGDHAIEAPEPETKIPEMFYRKVYALALCRIEPENNVHVILKAFEPGGSELVFIGNWQATDYGRRLFSSYSHFENFHLLDPIYDIETLYLYRKNCSVYIHGHSAGGTNPSLVEIMHFAKPVIAFDCKYNRASMEDRGYYFESAEKLQQIMTDFKWSSDLELRDIAQKRYTWSIVREQYAALFS